MVPSTQSHICPSIICSGRSSASKGLFGGAPAALAPSTVTEYCRGATGPSKRWLPPAPPLCSCILPKPEPASCALQCSTVLCSAPAQGAGAGESGCQTASKYWSTCHLFSSLWRWHAAIVDAVYLQISSYFVFFSNIFVFCCSVKNHNFEI
jgi:hypothetical protein